MHYHDSDDFKQLRELRTLAPAEFKVWLDLDSITGKEDGAIPRKFRELIAIAVACTTQCPYCLDAHTKNAKQARPVRRLPRPCSSRPRSGPARRRRTGCSP